MFSHLKRLITLTCVRHVLEEQNLADDFIRDALQTRDGFLHHLLLRHVQPLFLNALLTAGDEITSTVLCSTTTYTTRTLASWDRSYDYFMEKLCIFVCVLPLT